MSFFNPPFYLLIGINHGSSDDCEDDRIDSPGIFTRLKNKQILDYVNNGLNLIETLHQAAITGDLGQVRQMTQNLTNVNPIDNQGQTLLQNAYKNGRMKVVILLLERLQSLGIETAETEEMVEKLCKYF